MDDEKESDGEEVYERLAPQKANKISCEMSVKPYDSWNESDGVICFHHVIESETYCTSYG